MACIFCLDDNPETIIYKGICNCHPHIHIECINNWFKINPASPDLAPKSAITILSR